MPAGVRVSQLQPVLGSIISGFSFDGRPLNNEFRSALRDLLHNRGLVIFEPGTVNAENFTDFAGFLGEFFHYAGPHTPRAPAFGMLTEGFVRMLRLSQRCLRSNYPISVEIQSSVMLLGCMSSWIPYSRHILNP